jgi:glycogen operon protein
VQALILDSLRYLHTEIGFDGFRFDLATILGRHAHGFSTSHPLLAAISSDKKLADAKLIAEPWDPGPGGYQLGQFPERWAEWNDAFRDATRQFWRGDSGVSGELARRIHGSADLFEEGHGTPTSSINLVTAHDGYTLADLVSYEHRHNEANGEDNRDGHQHNYSRNYGAEGSTDDASIIEVRQRQTLNILATLLFSQGTPMLLAGDEFGHSQGGNNNAYAQDNKTTWIDWSLATTNAGLLRGVKELIQLRRENAKFRIDEFVHDSPEATFSDPRFQWLDKEGLAMGAECWEAARTFSVGISDGKGQLLIVLNSEESEQTVRVPEVSGNWRVLFSSGSSDRQNVVASSITSDPLSVAILAGGRADA